MVELYVVWIPDQKRFGNDSFLTLRKVSINQDLQCHLLKILSMLC